MEAYCTGIRGKIPFLSKSSWSAPPQHAVQHIWAVMHAIEEETLVLVYKCIHALKYMHRYMQILHKKESWYSCSVTSRFLSVQCFNQYTYSFIHTAELEGGRGKDTNSSWPNPAINFRSFPRQTRRQMDRIQRWTSKQHGEDTWEIYLGPIYTTTYNSPGVKPVCMSPTFDQYSEKRVPG